MTIVSARRTGAERAAAAVAQELGLPCAGSRDMDQNFRNSDGTLVLCLSQAPRWNGKTMGAIRRHGDRRAYVVPVREQVNARGVRAWVRQEKIRRLHITGSAPYTASCDFMRLVLDFSLQVPEFEPNETAAREWQFAGMEFGVETEAP